MLKVIWNQNVCLVTLSAMVLKSDHKQGNYSHLKEILLYMLIYFPRKDTKINTIYDSLSIITIK